MTSLMLLLFHCCYLISFGVFLHLYHSISFGFTFSRVSFCFFLFICSSFNVRSSGGCLPACCYTRAHPEQRTGHRGPSRLRHNIKHDTQTHHTPCPGDRAGDNGATGAERKSRTAELRDVLHRAGRPLFTDRQCGAGRVVYHEAALKR